MIMSLRAVIIDDEQRGINSLTILINKYVDEVKVVASSTKAQEAIDLIENYRPEIVFLDINMPEMNGFELLEKLTWKKFNLVFTTAHREYALKALKNDAMDYLLKPIDYEDIRIAVQKIQQRMQENASVSFDYSKFMQDANQNNKILINSKMSIESIDLDDVVSLESKSNYTQIYLSDSKFTLASKTLKEFEMHLCIANLNFMRVHHSYIVNLNKVSRFVKVTDTIVMIDDQKIPLAKSRKNQFFEWLNITS
jgi:two-component system LytT family response regulator